jgi:hypothetical protein
LIDNIRGFKSTLFCQQPKLSANSLQTSGPARIICKRLTKKMGFVTEPTFYEKTILSDLQGAWQCLREDVAEHPAFEGWERALFHIDEAMSWESVRNLRQMQRSLILVRNLLHQGDVPDAVAECLDAVSELMDETLEALSKGEIG